MPAPTNAATLRLHQNRQAELEQERSSLAATLPSRAAAAREHFVEIQELKDELELSETAMQEARRQCGEAQEKEAATLERLLPDMQSGAEENMRLQGTVHRLETALEREIEARNKAEAELTATQRLVAVLEETTAAASSPSSAALDAATESIEARLADRHAEQAGLLAQMASSLAKVEALNQDRGSDNDAAKVRPRLPSLTIW